MYCWAVKLPVITKLPVTIALLPILTVVPSSVIFELPTVEPPVNLTTVLFVPDTDTEVPDVPLEPEEPDVPLEPEEPLVPLDPELPDVPEEPDVPDEPLVPDVPDEPLVPDEPEEPANGEAARVL